MTKVARDGDCWERATLGSLCTRLTDGSHFSPSPQTYGQPIANVKDIGDGYVDLDSCTKITDEAFAQLETADSLISTGDVLLSKDGTIGRVVVYEQSETIGALSSICIMRPGGRIDRRFLGHALQSADFTRQIDNAVSGSALRRLILRSITALEVSVPPLLEQRHIAEILDTANEAIYKTERVIAKLREMKRGLLRDLLTRGVDENGDLRDPELNPEQFKDSPLGLLPSLWDVRTIERLLADVNPAMRSGPFGSALLKSELASEGVPLLGIDNVQVEQFVAEYIRFVRPEKAVELSRYLVRPRDVMITIMGTVGRCCVVPNDVGEALSSKHVWTLTFDEALYSPFLACLQFNYAPWVLSHFARDAQGGIMSAIRSETLRATMLPVPPRYEQDAIEAVLREAQKRLESESLTLEKLKLVKKGLMDDLLTGRVRVPVSEEVAA
ncbi:MAG: restriction endonuclease subunit S [Gaiellaceae bacterium]|jgi:type I restriction enzyme S subunit